MENTLILDALRQRQAKLQVTDYIMSKTLHMSEHSFLLRFEHPAMNSIKFINQYANALDCTVEFYVVVKGKKRRSLKAWFKALLSPKGGQKRGEYELINSL